MQADPATRATESSESNTRGTPRRKCMIMFLMCPPNLEAGRAGGRSDDPLLLRLTRQQPFGRMRILRTRIAPSIGRSGVSKNVPCCASPGFWSSQQTHWSVDNKRRQVQRERCERGGPCMREEKHSTSRSRQSRGPKPRRMIGLPRFWWHPTGEKLALPALDKRQRLKQFQTRGPLKSPSISSQVPANVAHCTLSSVPRAPSNGSGRATKVTLDSSPPF